MTHCTLISVDLAKNTFQVCMFNSHHKVISNKKVKRAQLMSGQTHASGFMGIAPQVDLFWVSAMREVDSEINTNSAYIAKALDYLVGRGVDVVVQDDTSVDFIAMNLCYEKECAPEVEVDLADAAQWSGDAFTEVQPGNLPSNDSTGRLSWAPSMNWFQFATPNTTAVLEIEFCACGDIYLDVERFKADNDGEVLLDGMVVVDQTGLGRWAFIEDTWFVDGGNGITGSGTTTVSGTGIGVDHKLEIIVSDTGVVSGAAIEAPFTLF